MYTNVSSGGNQSNINKSDSRASSSNSETTQSTHCPSQLPKQKCLVEEVAQLIEQVYFAEDAEEDNLRLHIPSSPRLWLAFHQLESDHASHTPRASHLVRIARGQLTSKLVMKFLHRLYRKVHRAGRGAQVD